jgi:hypothetical protein
MLTNFATNRIHIWPKSPRRHHARMEVAVSALRLAKRHLNIDSQRSHSLKQ